MINQNLCNHPIIKPALLVNEMHLKIVSKEKTERLTKLASTGFSGVKLFAKPSSNQTI